MKDWRIGERVHFKGSKGEVWKIIKIYNDYFGEEKIMLKNIHKEEVIDLSDFRNMLKITDKEQGNTQMRLPIMVFLTMGRRA